MLLRLTYQLMRFITDLVLVRTRSDAQVCAEVLALRHQLRVLERKVGKRRLPARPGSHCGKPVELTWAAVDSNHLPPRYQHGALPVELAAQFAGTGPRQASLLCR